MAQDILIVVDCKSNKVQMFCDPSILDSGSTEGSNELAVKVPVTTELRWRVVPLQLTDPQDAGVYHTIIESFRLWQNAGDYLIEWGTSNGDGSAPYYQSPGGLRPETSAPVAVEGINRPFVQCLTQLTSRDETQSPRVAYTFTVGIYKNGTRVDGITWDPYVTIYRQ